MIYYKKIYFPEKSLLLMKQQMKIINLIHFISYLIVQKIKRKCNKEVFLNYFDDKINIKIKNYISLISKFLDQILPLILNQNHPKQATYQLLRFLNEITPTFSI